MQEHELIDITRILTHLEDIEKNLNSTHGDVIRLQEQVSAYIRELRNLTDQVDKISDRITSVEKLVWRGGGGLAVALFIIQLLSKWINLIGG